ncbi:MAG: exodeoxyribonuclease VII small subunit [Candidatus Uhrbacteria bacterium]
MPPKKQIKQSFAKQFAELEAITAWFEREDVDLEEGIERFERGMVLAKELKVRLCDAEVKIEQIRKQFDESDS